MSGFLCASVSLWWSLVLCWRTASLPKIPVVAGELPVEEAGVEGLGFGDIGGGEFQVNEGIAHRVESFELEW